VTDDPLLASLARALEREPRNGELWLHYARLLEQAGRRDDGLAALRTAAELPDTRLAALRELVPRLRERHLLAEALLRCEAALAAGEDPALRAELRLIEAARAAAGEARPTDEAPAPVREPALRETAPAASDADWAKQFDWGDLHITLKDVEGLDEVKRQIRLRILAPFRDPTVFDAFGRSSGGGLLLYGPPGCGKTFLARATAGELGARFVAVSIHDVLDKYWGESEKLVHNLFELARRSAPTVLFFDEFDTLGGVRGRGESQFWRSVVDSFLQEMDGVKARNRDILLLAATNVPWHVDAAFRRPGRFDRVLFVPPPDAAGRRALLERHLRAVPGGTALRLDEAVRRTELFSGADLRALAERASEAALEESLESGKVRPIAQADLERVLAVSRSTVVEWMATARNYARYANEGGQYDEMAEFLKRSGSW